MVVVVVVGDVTFASVVSTTSSTFFLCLFVGPVLVGVELFA